MVGFVPAGRRDLRLKSIHRTPLHATLCTQPYVVLVVRVWFQCSGRLPDPWFQTDDPPSIVCILIPFHGCFRSYRVERTIVSSSWLCVVVRADPIAALLLASLLATLPLRIPSCSVMLPCCIPDRDTLSRAHTISIPTQKSRRFYAAGSNPKAFGGNRFGIFVSASPCCWPSDRRAAFWIARTQPSLEWSRRRHIIEQPFLSGKLDVDSLLPGGRGLQPVNLSGDSVDSEGSHGGSVPGDKDVQNRLAVFDVDEGDGLGEREE